MISDPILLNYHFPGELVETQASRCSSMQDAVLMFKTLVLSALYNFSDDQIEY